MSKRWSLVIVTVILAAAVALLTAAGLASAHAIVERTDPPDGAVLSAPPSQVSLWFTEGVLSDQTTVELVDGSGNGVPVEAVRSGSNEANLVIQLPNLATNAYRLSWRTVASDDLHATSGSITFGVQHAADIAATTSGGSRPHPDEVLMRWLSFGAIAALFGALAFALVLVPAAETQSSTLVTMVRRRLLLLALAGGLLALVAGIGLLLIQAAEVGAWASTWWHIVRGTAYGMRWLVRQGLLIALVGVVLLLLRRRTTAAPESRGGRAFLHSQNLALAVVAPLGLALVTVQALNGHAAGSNSGSAVRVGADALHLLSAGLWAGGLLALVAVILPLLRRGPTEAALARSVFRRFGWPAALSLAVLVITGIYASGQQVASLDALLTTLYGQALLLKVGLVILAGLIGLLNASLFHPGVARILGRVLRRPGGWSPLAPGRVRFTLLAESIGAVAVLLFAAVLTAAPPARGPEFEPPSEAVNTPPIVTANAADLVVTFTVKPNHPGQNFVLLGVHDTRRPAPAPIDGVDVQLLPLGGAPITLTAEPLGDGLYQVAGGSINATGDWQITATIRRQGLADAATTVPWTVTEAPPPSISRAVLISNRPLRPILTIAAIVLALLFSGALAGLWLERRLPEFLIRARPLASGQNSQSLNGRDRS